MGLSAKEAAERVGLSKQAIIKAMRSGRISGQKNERGEWEIEPVELFRVYSPVGEYGTQQPEQTSSPRDTDSLQVENRLLRERIADKDSQIEDLRRRLDAESEERRRLSLLLTDNQHPRSWWARLFGGGD